MVICAKQSSNILPWKTKPTSRATGLVSLCGGFFGSVRGVKTAEKGVKRRILACALRFSVGFHPVCNREPANALFLCQDVFRIAYSSPPLSQVCLTASRSSCAMASLKSHTANSGCLPLISAIVSSAIDTETENAPYFLCHTGTQRSPFFDHPIRTVSQDVSSLPAFCDRRLRVRAAPSGNSRARISPVGDATTFEE